MAWGIRCLRIPAFLALAGVLVLLALVEVATAAPACRQQVIDDWADNGRVDRVYALDCYEQAIESLPADIRDYSDAHDSIERGLTLAVRAKSGASRAAKPTGARGGSSAAVRAVDTSGSAGMPAPLLALAALGGAGIAAGALIYVSRQAGTGQKGRPG
jgi:hypothetical protein